MPVADVGYDGYYDDVLPDDAGKVRQELDQAVLKKIAMLIAGVAVIIIACGAVQDFVAVYPLSCQGKQTGMVLEGAGEESYEMAKACRPAIVQAELICLFEKRLEPSEHLLHTENRQTLVEQLYTAETIADGILETKMEQAECRDEIVGVLLRLLKKKKIVVL